MYYVFSVRIIMTIHVTQYMFKLLHAEPSSRARYYGFGGMTGILYRSQGGGGGGLPAVPATPVIAV